MLVQSQELNPRPPALQSSALPTELILPWSKQLGPVTIITGTSVQYLYIWTVNWTPTKKWEEVWRVTDVCLQFKMRAVLQHQGEAWIDCGEIARYLTPSLNLLTCATIQRENSLCHIAMVAKFLNDNKLKIHVKSKFSLLQTSLILFNFI